MQRVWGSGLVMAVLFMGGVLPAAAEGLRSAGEIRSTLRVALVQAQGDHMAEFFAAIKPFWLISDDGYASAMAKTTAARVDVQKKLGKSLGMEEIKVELVSDTVMKVVYLEKFQRSCLIWNFFFYKPETEWVLTTFEWDESIRSLFM